MYGAGITLLVRAELGAAPWDVFHTGISARTGVGIGSVILVTGALLLLFWIPLRVRPGVGTILNAALVGIFVNLMLPAFPDVDLLIARVPMMFGGIVAIAIGSGLYIGTGLGPGPRDGLMTGLSELTVGGRRISVRAARTVVEVCVLSVGIALGGAVGIGTAVFTVGIGPLVQLFLPPLTMSGTAGAPENTSGGVVRSPPTQGAHARSSQPRRASPVCSKHG